MQFNVAADVSGETDGEPEMTASLPWQLRRWFDRHLLDRTISLAASAGPLSRWPFSRLG